MAAVPAWRVILQETLTARRQVFELLAATKWMLAIALFASAVLWLPAQILELYRITYSDSESFADIIRLFSSVFLIAMALAAGMLVTVRASAKHLHDPHRFALLLVGILPAAAAALPFAAAAAGQWQALPPTPSAAELAELNRAGGPWRDFVSELMAIRSPLTWSAIAFAGLAVIVFIAVLVSAQRLDERFDPVVRLMLRGKGLMFTVVPITIFAILFFLAPLALPRAIGTFGVAAAFFISVILFTTQFGILSNRYRVPFIPLFLAAALAWSVLDLNDNHMTRKFDGSSPPLKPMAEAGSAFIDWLQTRPGVGNYPDGYPVYVVAAQGGGLYAAYQTAVFLARLQDSEPKFRDHLFAISAVSGGSVGAAGFVTALETQIEPTGDSGEARFDSYEAVVRQAFSKDYLAPLVAASLFADFTQRFLPFSLETLDRARALEFAFENGFTDTGMSKPSLMEQDFLAHWRADGRSPALILNATDAASGRRFAVSPFMLTKGSPRYSSKSAMLYYPLWPEALVPRAKEDASFDPWRPIRLSTAAAISARFPWVTPAATLEVRAENGDKMRLRLVDGGYVDNSGVETALDLIDSLQSAIDAAGGKLAIKPVIHLVVLTGGQYPLRTSYAAGETLEPVRALLSTRESRAYQAIARARRQMPPTPYDAGSGRSVLVPHVRAVSLDNRFYSLPLGWRLSGRTRDIIARQSGTDSSCVPNESLEQGMPGHSNADCVSVLIKSEIRGKFDGYARSTAADIFLEGQNRYAVQSGRSFDYEAMMNCYGQKPRQAFDFRAAQSVRNLLKYWEDELKFTDPRILAFLLALIDHETAHFRLTEQVGSAERLEGAYGKDSVLGKTLGNTLPGDGSRYRGRGLLQTTGRRNYEALQVKLEAAEPGNRIDIVEDPELLSRPYVAVRAAYAHLFSARDIESYSEVLSTCESDCRNQWSSLVRRIGGPRLPADKISDNAAAFHGCIADSRVRETAPY